MSRSVETDAVVLRLVDQGDRNRIVTLFTPSAGRTACVARGARGSKHRFGGHLDLFHRGRADLGRPRRTGGLPPLSGFVVTDPYEAIRADIVRFATASFFVEIVITATAAGDANPGQFAVLVESLGALSRGEESTRRDLILAFQLRWFDAMGELPPLHPENLRQARLPHLDEQPLAIARALLSGMEIPELDARRFRAVGGLTRAVRNRVLRKPLESTHFLYQVLDDG